MPATTAFHIVDIKDDFLNALRVNLNSVDPLARVTETTTNFTATSGQTIFPLDTQTMSYVKSVTIDSVPKILHVDYEISWTGANQGSVILTVGATVGASVSIIWGDISGSSNFIYPDMPRTDISQNTQPRIGFQLTDSSQLAGAGGGTAYGIWHDILLQIKVVGRDTYEVDSICQSIKNYIEPNCKNFYYFRFITPKTLAEYDNFSDNTKQSCAKVMEYEVNQKLQVITYA